MQCSLVWTSGDTFPHQLERRADIFFSLYLSEALSEKLDCPMKDEIVPEFPVQNRALGHLVSPNRSKKIDYLAISQDGTKAFFVELKTDTRSRRTDQDQYLTEAQDVGMTALLKGLLRILRDTKMQRKYLCLLAQLEVMGLVQMPKRMYDLMSQESLRGVGDARHSIQITSQVSECQIVYILPSSERASLLTNGDAHEITFDEFRSVVSVHDDPLSKRFARSLETWTSLSAGGCRPAMRAREE